MSGSMRRKKRKQKHQLPLLRKKPLNQNLRKPQSKQKKLPGVGKDQRSRLKKQNHHDAEKDQRLRLKIRNHQKGWEDPIEMIS